MNYAVIEDGVAVNIVVCEKEEAKKAGFVVLPERYRIGDKYEGGTWSKRELTPEEIFEVDNAVLAEIISKTQERLEAFAQSRGYDGVDSVAKYNGSKNPRYAADFRTISAACSDTWDAVFAYQNDVITGQTPKPTGYADVEPHLPVLEWPTTTTP